MVIVADTLRADRLGAYGNSRGLTPFLDELAAQGTVFLNAYSTTSYTVPSVASLFTSRYPSQHHVVNYDSRIGDTEITLAEQLKEVGYATAGVSANPQLSQDRYGKGFELWSTFEQRKPRGVRIRWEVQRWLDSRRGAASSQPTFLYLHYLEPHAPYEPPEQYRKQLMIDVTPSTEDAAKFKSAKRLWKELRQDEVELLESLYDAEVAAFDGEIRQLFDRLQRSGLLENTIVVITADHGEEFKDHGQMGHGRSLYNELVHVPLIIVSPGRAAAVTRENVSLVDVAPTLLDLVGRQPPPVFEGRSLTPLLGSARGWQRLTNLTATLGWVGTMEQRPIIVELERTSTLYDLRRHSAGIISGSIKLLRSSGREEMYDLSVDPGEKTASSGDVHSKAASLRIALDSIENRLRARAAIPAQAHPLDDRTKEQLRALGYNPE